MTRAIDHSLMSRRRGPARSCAVVTVLSVVVWWCTWAEAKDERAKPAEEARFSAAAFRAGLKKRGLTELLDLYLKEFPPSGRTATLLMRRELRLAEFADTNRSKEERAAAIDRANRLLEEVIDHDPKDRRRFDWRFTLAHSLLYDQAEPFFTSILYRGEVRPQDRPRLRELTTRSVSVLLSLVDEFSAEYERIDDLPIPRFERLERDGYVAELDRLAPRADYLLLWALYYDSLSRDDTDPTRASRLNRIRTAFGEEPALIETAHAISRVQVQALLLIGMTNRLLEDHPTARGYFDRALQVARRLDDPAEIERIGWAITLARIERIRNDRDDDRFDHALRGVTEFRESLSRDGGDEFGLLVVAALLERSVYQARAEIAEREGRTVEAKRDREQAFKPLEALVQCHPDRRNEVYATMYELMGSQVDPDRLDPFEQCALVAGLLSEADRDPQAADSWLDYAIRVGERFVAEVPDAAEALVPQVLYNVAVAHYRRGQTVQAAATFLTVARNHEKFINALDAATYAVQLASALYEDASAHDRPEVQRLYLDALEVLLTGYSKAEASRYWRFYYAQLLDELGRHDAATAQFALVGSEHERYVESTFFQVRSMALALEMQCREDANDQIDIRRRMNDFFTTHRDFVIRASSQMGREPDPARAALLHELIGRAKLLGGEVQVLPQVDRPAQGLESVAGFETTYPELFELSGRVWRVRLVAYEQLGRLDEATQAIPAYIAADPENAGPALQSLYVALADDVERLRVSSDDPATQLTAQRKADLALLLARQVYEWSGRFEGPTASRDRGRLLVQLAEANLLAGQYERALELFEQCQAGGTTQARRQTPEDDTGISGHAPGREAAASGAAPADAGVAFGRAEALFHLDRFAEALPQFNELALKLPETDPLRWQSLLRDLQCRTELGHRARDIIKVIEQQRYLHPDLGGPHLASEFEELLRKNRRRTDEG